MLQNYLFHGTPKARENIYVQAVLLYRSQLTTLKGPTEHIRNCQFLFGLALDIQHSLQSFSCNFPLLFWGHTSSKELSGFPQTRFSLWVHSGSCPGHSAWWFYWGTVKEYKLKLCSVLVHKYTWNKEYFCSSCRILGVKSKGYSSVSCSSQLPIFRRAVQSHACSKISNTVSKQGEKL